MHKHYVGEIEAQKIFKFKWPRLRPNYTQNVTNMAKSMAYITNKLGDGFQQGGCLYKPTNGIQWTPRHSWTSTNLRNKPKRQQTSQILAVLLIVDENCALPLCVYMVSFNKANHIII